VNRIRIFRCGLCLFRVKIFPPGQQVFLHRPMLLRPPDGNVRQNYFAALDPEIALRYFHGSLVGYRRRNRPEVGCLPFPLRALWTFIRRDSTLAENGIISSSPKLFTYKMR